MTARATKSRSMRWSGLRFEDGIRRRGERAAPFLSFPPRGLSVCLARPKGDLLDNKKLLAVIGGKKEPIVTHASPENTFPFLALQSFHALLKWIRGHLGNYALYAFLNGLR